MVQPYDVLQLCVVSSVTSLVILMARALRRKMRTAGEEHGRAVERRLEEFQPGPLIEADAQRRPFHEIPAVPDAESCFDFVKVDFLSLSADRKVLDSAADCIRKYSVGTCGPRGFFGTIDVHLELEERLARFLKAECGIVYSFGFITTSSCIHCYCKRDTTVFVDEQASRAIQMGVETAGSRKVVLKHNDARDFARKAEQVNDDTRLKVLIVEGICSRDGSICDFPAFLAVCKKHKVRILLDESISFGVLGEHGRGITEHFRVDVDEIDVIMGSLEYALAGYGGFCAGSATAIQPQRLTSLGFVFSASLPTFCAQAAIATLELVGDRPRKLRALSTVVHDFLCGFPELRVRSHRESPLKVFSVRGDDDDDASEALAERLRRTLADNRTHVLLWDGVLLKMNLFLDLSRADRLERFFKVFGEAVRTALHVTSPQPENVPPQEHRIDN